MLFWYNNSQQGFIQTDLPECNTRARIKDAVTAQPVSTAPQPRLKTFNLYQFRTKNFVSPQPATSRQKLQSGLLYETNAAPLTECQRRVTFVFEKCEICGVRCSLRQR